MEKKEKWERKNNLIIRGWKAEGKGEKKDEVERMFKEKMNVVVKVKEVSMTGRED